MSFNLCMSNARRVGRTKKISDMSAVCKSLFQASCRRLGIQRLMSAGRITATRINTHCSEHESSGCKNISIEIFWNREIKSFCRGRVNKSKIIHQPRYLESQEVGTYTLGGRECHGAESQTLNTEKTN